jgi:hypothetical protein
MKRWLKRALMVVGVVILSAAFITPLFQGWALHHKLVTLTDEAVSIKVIEHSDYFDRNRSNPYHEKVHRSVSLTPAQINQWHSAIPLSLDYSYALRLKCIFSSHHRVEITAKDGKVTVLEICFHCGELALNKADSRIFPVGWNSTLRQFISSIGLNPGFDGSN